METSARRAAILAAGALLLGLGATSATVPATAAPTVAFAAKLLPVKGFPGTGNRARAGAALKLEYTITGTEFGGDPPPLTGIRLAFPEGLEVAQGWPSCPSTLPGEQQPEACPIGSRGGPPGELTAVAEPPGTETTVPLLPVVVAGGLALAPEGPPDGFDLAGSYAPGSTDPSETPVLSLSLQFATGAPAFSVRRLVFTIGSGLRIAGRDRYYLGVPAGCQNGMHPDSVLTFAQEGAPNRPLAVDAVATMPCPRPPKVAQAPTVASVAPPPPCRSARRITIHVDPPTGVAYRQVRVVVDGRSLRVRRRGGGFTALVDLRGLPRGSYAVRVIATTGSGRRIIHTRHYRTCGTAVNARGRV
jgi:hypothetical protein